VFLCCALDEMSRGRAVTGDSRSASKVPAVVPLFWLIKILTTTLGETGGDAISMSMNLGYLVGTAIFATLFLIAVALQIRAKAFVPALYWLTIVATTTVGTTLADFVDRSLGIGYPGGAAILAAWLAAALLAWHEVLGTVAVDSVSSPASEAFYWVTILLSQTLGTALGDWAADSMQFGYAGSAMIFGALLAVLAMAYFRTHISRTLLFWCAFVVTRPLGAVVGDWLDKPLAHGGLALSRYSASLALLVCIALLIVLFPQRAASREH
jgi:uncharacterized membrane-anchored protein